MKPGFKPKTSVAVKKENGTYRSNTHKNKVDALAAKGLPSPPDWLEKPEMDLWLLITEDLPSVVLGRLDQVHLEELMVCHKQLRALRPKWMAAPEDKMLRCQYLDVQKQLMRLGDMFGMSPGSRAQMTMPDTSSEESPMFHLVSKFG